MSVVIQLKRGTAAAWTAANPVLADGELGRETDTGLYKFGDGVTAWNARPYQVLRSVDEATVLSMEDQGTPAVPANGKMNLYAKSLAGRMLLRQQGPSGLSTPLQPSFFQNSITIISTGQSTAVSVIGNAVVSVGTLSHPVQTEAYGYMANFASAATVNLTAGTGTSAPQCVRGSVPGGANGFFISQRLAFPDATYNQTAAATGSRIFVGATEGTLATSVTADNPAGNFCGFMRRHVAGAAQDTNWQFGTKNGSQLNLIDTGMVFAPQSVYDFYIFCPPMGTKITWRIDNLTSGTSYEGETSLYLPTDTVWMRAGFQVGNVNALSRNVRMQRVYIESDR